MEYTFTTESGAEQAVENNTGMNTGTQVFTAISYYIRLQI